MPENSDFTSIPQRLKTVARAGINQSQQAQPDILQFTYYQPHSKQQIGLPFKLIEYFQLVEWTGRCIREGKRSAIPKHIKPIFERFMVDEQD
jgi:LEA14-like dessication related protein